MTGKGNGNECFKVSIAPYVDSWAYGHVWSHISERILDIPFQNMLNWLADYFKLKASEIQCLHKVVSYLLFPTCRNQKYYLKLMPFHTRTKSEPFSQELGIDAPYICTNEFSKTALYSTSFKLPLIRPVTFHDILSLTYILFCLTIYSQIYCSFIFKKCKSFSFCHFTENYSLVKLPLIKLAKLVSRLSWSFQLKIKMGREKMSRNNLQPGYLVKSPIDCYHPYADR